MTHTVRTWLTSWSTFFEMRRDWQAVLSLLPKNPNTAGASTVRWYSTGEMPLRRRWAWVEDCPSIEVATAGRGGLLPGPGSRALDFSSGVGRNAFFLLKRGLGVRSIVYPDATGSQLAFQEKWAGRYRKTCPGAGSIEVVPGEFARFDLGDHPFDLVVCVNALMHVPLAVGREAIRHMQRQTAAGGLHLITTYTNADGYHGLASVSDDTFVTSGRAKEDELQRLYPTTEWEHIGSSPQGLPSTRDNRGRRCARSVIVARKRAPTAGA